jgi:NADH:ubiquinone oxidoreductase subunit 2 (subunit N)
MVVVIISMASMSVGNIMALRQTNVKRMLAFSGISHWFYVDDFVEFVYIGKFIILYCCLFFIWNRCF